MGMWLPDWNSVGNNLVADAIVIAATSATVRAAISRVARITLDRGQEVAFWLLVPTVLALGLIALHLNAPIAGPVASRSDWPTLSDNDIRDLGKSLEQYHPIAEEISYGDERDEPLAVSFARAMFAAQWPDAGVGKSGTIIGITISGFADTKPEMDTSVLENETRDAAEDYDRRITGTHLPDDRQQTAALKSERPNPLRKRFCDFPESC